MNNFNLNISIDDIQVGDGNGGQKFLEAGIHKVNMSDVRFDISEPGKNKFICFTFEDENKATTTDTEYEPTPAESADSIPQFIRDNMRKAKPDITDAENLLPLRAFPQGYVSHRSAVDGQFIM